MTSTFEPVVDMVIDIAEPSRALAKALIKHPNVTRDFGGIHNFINSYMFHVVGCIDSNVTHEGLRYHDSFRAVSDAYDGFLEGMEDDTTARGIIESSDIGSDMLDFGGAVVAEYYKQGLYGDTISSYVEFKDFFKEGLLTLTMFKY